MFRTNAELISEAGVPLNCDAYVSTLAPNKDQIKQDQQDIESVHQVLLEKVHGHTQHVCSVSSSAIFITLTSCHVSAV